MAAVRRRDLIRILVQSVLPTLTGMAAVWLTNDTPLSLAGFAILLLVAPTVAFRYGLPSGLASSALTMLFWMLYFSEPGRPFRYTVDDLRPVLILSLLSLILTLMIGLLRRAVRAGEVELRRQLNFANVVTSSLGEGVYALDREGRLTLLNPAAERMLGWSEEELLGKVMHDAIHFRHADGSPSAARDCALLRVLRSGETYRNDDDVFVTKDGKLLPVAYTSAPIVDDGRVAGAVVAFRDIGERKRAEEELQRSEASLAEAQRIAHLGSWEWDVTTDEVRWSDETYRLYGFTPGEVAPDYERFFACIHPDDREHVRRALHDALYEGKPYEIEHRVIRPDGSVRTVHRQGEVISDDSGRPVRMVGTVLDITERRRAQEQAERALTLRNQFLSIASHELKTPVTLLKGYAQLLLERAKEAGDTDALKPLGVMNRQVNRMTVLIDDLLEVSRIESGRLQFDMAPFELNPALEEVIDEIRMSTPGFVFTVDERAGDLRVRGDRMRIQRVLTNLLTNAVKYSGKSREVEISIRRDDSQAVVSVRDYGIGIPAEQQSQVFELYFRGSNVSTMHYGGLGLGLFISRVIVERHGGTIGASSEEGKGSTFHFSLPLLDAQAP